ncbi:unnamed protein product [Rhizophagus irregularis]|nr:unnamed protein product [Rhizophagus irregularis]
MIDIDISFVCLQRFFLRWFIFLRSLKATLNNNVVTVTEPSFKKTFFFVGYSNIRNYPITFYFRSIMYIVCTNI